MTILLVFGTMLAAPSSAYAAGDWFNPGGFFSGLINFIAQRFGLDKTQVQTAFTDYQNQQKALITSRPTPGPQDRLNREKFRLDTLVSQGKITSDQETAVLNELQSLWSQYPVNSGMTPGQRRTQLENLRSAWKTWAQANNIDPNIVAPFGMGFGWGRGGRNGGFYRFMKP